MTLGNMRERQSFRRRRLCILRNIFQYILKGGQTFVGDGLNSFVNQSSVPACGS